MMNPQTQRPGNHPPILASMYPAAYAMVAKSNSHFSLTAQRLVLPALPLRRPRTDLWPDNNFLQFMVGERAASSRPDSTRSTLEDLQTQPSSLL